MEISGLGRHRVSAPLVVVNGGVKIVTVGGAAPIAIGGGKRRESPSFTIREVPDNAHVLWEISGMSVTPSGAHSMNSL